MIFLIYSVSKNQCKADIWPHPGIESHVHLQSDSGNRRQYWMMLLISVFVHFPSFFMASSVYQRPDTSDSLDSIFSQESLPEKKGTWTCLYIITTMTTFI